MGHVTLGPRADLRVGRARGLLPAREGAGAEPLRAGPSRARRPPRPALPLGRGAGAVPPQRGRRRGEGRAGAGPARTSLPAPCSATSCSPAGWPPCASRRPASSCSTPTPTSARTTRTASRCTAERAGRHAGAPRTRAAWCSRCTSPTGYPAANDEVIADCARIRGPAHRLLPARPGGRPARRGAALPRAPEPPGIKLHPRAERFALDTAGDGARVRARGRARPAGAGARRTRDPRAGRARGEGVRAPSRACG